MCLLCYQNSIYFIKKINKIQPLCPVCCGDLNEDSPLEAHIFEPWFSVGGMIWKELRGVGGSVSSWRAGFEVSKPIPHFPLALSAFCLWVKM